MRIEIIETKSKMPSRTRVSTQRGKVPSPKKKKKRSEPKSVSKLMKELDAVFSQWVRLSHANKEGIVSCYTCGYQNHYKKMQNGHFISRFYKATRWDKRNCRVQCVMCNMWRNGDIATFRENLVKELGEEVVREIEISRNISQKLDRDLLMEKIGYYRQLLNDLI